MILKELNRADLPLISEIVELDEEASGGIGGVDLWILKALLRYGKVFVLEKEKKIISIVEYMQCVDKKEVFLYGICTLRVFRHMGNAKKIMNESEKYLKEKGYEAISLTVDPENKIAIEMYEHLGYEIVEYQENEYGKGIHRYLMKKKLVI